MINDKLLSGKLFSDNEKQEDEDEDNLVVWLDQ